jgi:ADP-ribosylglycohydrolase
MFKADCLVMARLNYTPKQGFGVHRGTGGNFRESVRTQQPVTTAGLGAAMRVGPVATLFDDPQEMVDWTLAVSETTTDDPVGLASAVKFAAVVWAVSHPESRDKIRDVVWPVSIDSQVWEWTTTALRIMNTSGGEDALLAFADQTGWANKKMSCAANGFGLTGMAWAVWAGLSGRSFEQALTRACSSGGDTDTVAAMAGCLAAIKFGRESIPEWMQLSLYDGGRIILEPEKWTPEYEADPTKADYDYRFEIMKVLRAERARKAKQEPSEEPRQTLDLFDFLTEDEDPE